MIVNMAIKIISFVTKDVLVNLCNILREWTIYKDLIENHYDPVLLEEAEIRKWYHR